MVHAVKPIRMRSKAHLKSHPLHPMLIPFPLAFFTGTFLFDILGYINNNFSFWQTGSYLQIAGVGFALLAAVPGIIDYTYTVPPKSSAKKRAATHGLLNVINVLLQAGVWFYRRGNDDMPMLVLVLEAAGLALLVIAGWMGGTLVYRNQIGVDQRYANAGKWNEAYIDETSGKIKVATVDELKENSMKLLHLNGKRIVLAKTEEGFAAFDDRCPHKGGSLAGGSIMCGTVQCPWHGSQFKVKDGSVTAGPAKEKIDVYNVMVQGNDVYLDAGSIPKV